MQCLQPDYPVSSADAGVGDTDSTMELTDQPFATSAMGESMDSDLLPELSGEIWVAAAQLDSASNETDTGVVLSTGFKPAGSIPNYVTVTKDLPPACFKPAGFLSNSMTVTDDLFLAGFKPAGLKPNSMTVTGDTQPAGF